MRLFGRKANQQSASPNQPNVPPELQPYYGKPSLRSHLRRIGMFVLPVIAALALIAALIAGGLWLKNHSENNKVATNQSAQQPSTNNSQGNSGSQNSTNQNQPAQPQPSGSSSGTAGGTDNSSSRPAPSTTPTTNNQAAAQSNIPNTGPDPSMYLIALVTAAAGTAVAYARQLKTDRR